ncbi:hypothetical protein BDBG_16701, partial [Blastomyces gilchristii SLH14081]
MNQQRTKKGEVGLEEVVVIVANIVHVCAVQILARSPACRCITLCTDAAKGHSCLGKSLIVPLDNNESTRHVHSTVSPQFDSSSLLEDGWISNLPWGRVCII